MSLFEKYFKGWSFRTANPTLQSGDEINVFLAEYDGEEDAALAYIGDTRLYVTGVGSEHIGKQIRVAINEFNPTESIGYGEFVEVVGDSSYSG